MYKLEGKIVLVTGGANGIGAAIVTEVLEEGAQHVRILDINENAGAKLEYEVNNKFGANKAKFVKCDVTNDKELFEAIDTTKEELGYLDLFVNNAGVGNEKDYSAIRKQIEINYIALVNGTLRAIEIMDKSKKGRGGTVINTASTAGLYPLCPPLFTYCSTKSAVLQFTECIGDKSLFDSNGVRVIALCYGPTNTAIFDALVCFGGPNQTLADIVAEQKYQSVSSAAKGAIAAYKQGKSASVWLIKDDLPALDISKDRQKNHDAMMMTLLNR